MGLQELESEGFKRLLEFQANVKKEGKSQNLVKRKKLTFAQAKLKLACAKPEDEKGKNILPG
jgi:hypothetical protein